MQRLVFAEASDSTLENEELNIGLVRPLASPFNLFLNFDQLINPDKLLVYFFVYSMGERKVVLWGVYDKPNQKFIVDGGCHYKGAQLLEITNRWKDRGYHYAANSVVDRITPTVAGYLGVDMWTYEKYVDMKRLYRYLIGEISDEAMVKQYGDYFLYELVPVGVDLTDDYELREFMLSLEAAIASYESQINRTDLSEGVMSRINRSVQKLLLEITERFDKQIQTGKFDLESYEKSLKSCPASDKCKINGKSPSECEVYVYGSDGHLYEGDPDLVL